MNINEILEQFGAHPKLNDLALHLRKGSKSIHWQGLAGSGPAFMSAVLFKQFPLSQVIILPGEEEAEYFRNDLENLVDEKKILFLSDSYKKPYQLTEIAANKIQRRTESLSKLQTHKDRKYIIVTYPAAICELIIDKEHFNKNTHLLSVGDKLNLDFLIEILHDFGFEKVDFVYEAGQFSVRGGILDIFSFAMEEPVRIEFDGNTIESVRVFDVVSQLSLKKLDHFNLISDISNAEGNIPRIPFTQYLSDCIIMTHNLSDQYDLYAHSFDKLKAKYDSELSAIPYSDPELFLEELKRFPKIEWGQRFQFKESLLMEFNQQAQPVFGKNIEMAINHLKENEVHKITNLLFSDQVKQLERFHTILQDKQRQISYFPVYKALKEGFVDRDLKLAVYTEHELFSRYFRFKNKRKVYSQDLALTIKELKELKPGDFVTHIDHGIGKFAGLQKMDFQGNQHEVVRIIYKDNDMLFVNINSLHKISRFSGKDGTEPKLHKLGSPVWDKQKTATKKKVKDIARELIKLYAIRKAQQGFAFAPDTYLQTELEASFIYEDTPDQAKATEEIKKDMEKPFPMDRLLCGDVGFGKTEVAIRAAWKAVADGKQVGILVPTTILAQQHFRTISERLEGYPCKVDYINRFKNSQQQKQTIKQLSEGKIDILIGTHRLLGKDIVFKDLGLLIIDEEQKFGVTAKEKLRHLRANVDTLTLTATPIPRTLHFSLMGARDLSVINTPPPNRQPIETSLGLFNDEVVKEAIEREVGRNGQVFFVHHRIKDILSIKEKLEILCPGVSVAVGHGQMDGNELEKIILQFMEGDYDVLVATTIIETGLDIANCNTIIINNAHMFGLSDLHQLRGRVGRSNRKAYCLLLAPPVHKLNEDARKRLRTIEEFSDLGSGFHVAMRDLDIRGAGNLLGAEQSGFISEIGFDMYHKILDEAISELKADEFKEIFKDQIASVHSRDCQVDASVEMMITDEYVSNISERLALYQELSNISKEEELEKFTLGLIDRFGPLPKRTMYLLKSVRIKWMGKKLGFEKIVIQQDLMRLYFPSSQSAQIYQSDFFPKLMSYIAANPFSFDLKQSSKSLILTCKSIHTLDQAFQMLCKIEQDVYLEKPVLLEN